jgi:putative transposase
MKDRYNFSSHTVYNLSYHLIWCTKYRRSVLNDIIQVRLKELIHQKAAELGAEVKALETMEDHVHLFVSAKPIHGPHLLAAQFKGFTSKILRNEFKVLRQKLPTLWTRSYYVESVGHISAQVVKRYIEDQKKV